MWTFVFFFFAGLLRQAAFYIFPANKQNYYHPKITERESANSRSQNLPRAFVCAETLLRTTVDSTCLRSTYHTVRCRTSHRQRASVTLRYGRHVRVLIYIYVMYVGDFPHDPAPDLLFTLRSAQWAVDHFLFIASVVLLFSRESNHSFRKSKAESPVGRYIFSFISPAAFGLIWPLVVQSE